MASQKFREYVDGLTEDTDPDIDADWVHTNDASDSAPKKVKPRNLTKKIQLNADLGTDDTYEGITIVGKNAGETLTQWDAVYLKSDGKWWLASAEFGATNKAWGLAVTAGTANNPLTVLAYGIVRNDAWAWTVGGEIYLSVDGALSHTTMSASGDIVQQVGYAISADIAFFDFNSTVTEVP